MCRAKHPSCPSACAQLAPHAPAQSSTMIHRADLSLSWELYYYCPPLQAFGHNQPDAMLSSCAHPMPALPGLPEKSPAPPFDTFEYFQDKEDNLDKPYNDRSYLSSEGLARDDARTGKLPVWVGSSDDVGYSPALPTIIFIPSPEFVALLTSGPEPWHPTSSAVAKARFTLLRSYLLFSISYER